jgi:hypothetical protein
MIKSRETSIQKLRYIIYIYIGRQDIEKVYKDSGR